MKRSFSASLKNVKKTNNHKTGKSAKIALREQVLTEIGANQAHVFDAFAGAGMMYRHVWHCAASYAGCDLEWYPDQRLAYVADNRRVLRTVDLSPFNIFDLDAYGSPWEHLLILVNRKPMTADGWWAVMTVGEGFSIKLGGMPLALRQLLGLQSVPAGASRVDYTRDALNGVAKMMNATVGRHLQATVASKLNVEYHAAKFVASP